MHLFVRILCLLAVFMVPGLSRHAAAQMRNDASLRLGYSQMISERQLHVTDKVPQMLRFRQQGAFDSRPFHLGGRFMATQIWERTNTSAKYPILSRLPPSHAQGTSDSYGVINDVTVHATLALPMIMAFAQGEYTEVAYKGQDDVQLRQYWVVIGDLAAAPYYVAFGRKTISFGRFESYLPFTHSHSAHYFWAVSKDPVLEFGYVTDQTELSLTLIPDHRGRRVLSTPDNNGALRNFAINAVHRLDLGADRRLVLGGGFLRGTIYDSAIAHHPPATGVNRRWNGAWDLNLTYETARFDVGFEYTQTQRAWPATGHRVSAATLQGRYRRQVFNRPAVYSVSYSRGVQGAAGTEWEDMEQLVFGLDVQVAKHVKIGAEYMINKGFVPLIRPLQTGDRSVRSETLIIGARVVF